MTTTMERLAGLQELRDDLLNGRKAYPLECWDVFGEIYRVASPRRVQVARKLRSLSRRQLADRVGVSATWITRVETGTRDLMGADLVLVAEALQVPVSSLVDMRPHGGKIAQARTHLEISTTDLAAQVGKPQSWVLDLEAGTASAEPEEVFQLAAALGVPVSELVIVTATET